MTYLAPSAAVKPITAFSKKKSENIYKIVLSQEKKFHALD